MVTKHFPIPFVCQILPAEEFKPLFTWEEIKDNPKFDVDETF